MKLEQEKIQLIPLKLQPSQDGGVANDPSTGASFRLSHLQYSYLDILKNGTSIEGLVQFFLGQGWLVSFRELSALLNFLANQGWILNTNFQNFFRQKVEPEGLLSKIWSNVSGDGKPTSSMRTLGSLRDLPFFRSLPDDVSQYLLKKTETLQVPASTRILKAGSQDRDLYVVLKGQAFLYRPVGTGRQLIAVLNEGSIFGERGFLLGHPRSADVVTSMPSQILKVHHLPEFDGFIKSDKAKKLQQRFWVLQALLSSPFFKDLPTDSLDSLIFKGRIVHALAEKKLFSEGQPGNTCFILIQGSVVISQKGHTINVLNQGSCFGEISLLMSGGVRTATVTTQRECLLLEIQQQEFYQMLSQNLILAAEIETLAAERLGKDFQRGRL